MTTLAHQASRSRWEWVRSLFYRHCLVYTGLHTSAGFFPNDVRFCELITGIVDPWNHHCTNPSRKIVVPRYCQRNFFSVTPPLPRIVTSNTFSRLRAILTKSPAISQLSEDLFRFRSPWRPCAKLCFATWEENTAGLSTTRQAVVKISPFKPDLAFITFPSYLSFSHKNLYKRALYIRDFISKNLLLQFSLSYLYCYKWHKRKKKDKLLEHILSNFNSVLLLLQQTYLHTNYIH